jgi:hypothetical protein
MEQEQEGGKMDLMDFPGFTRFYHKAVAGKMPLKVVINPQYIDKIEEVEGVVGIYGARACRVHVSVIGEILELDRYPNGLPVNAIVASMKKPHSE